MTQRLALALFSTFDVTSLHVETFADSVLTRVDPAWRFYRETVDRFETISAVVLSSVLLALGCAYAMHGLAAAAAGVRPTRAPSGGPSSPWYRARGGAGRLLWGATAVGSVAMVFVRIDPVRYLATFGTVGTLLVMLGAATFVPVRRASLGASLSDVGVSAAS